jgi:hypothetical protein
LVLAEVMHHSGHAKRIPCYKNEIKGEFHPPCGSLEVRRWSDADLTVIALPY